MATTTEASVRMAPMMPMTMDVEPVTSAALGPGPVGIAVADTPAASVSFEWMTLIILDSCEWRMI